MLVAVAVMRGRLGQPDDDEPSVGGLQHLDRDAVEAAQRLGGDHLARRADGRVPGAEVDDAVQVGAAAG